MEMIYTWNMKLAFFQILEWRMNGIINFFLKILNVDGFFFHKKNKEIKKRLQLLKKYVCNCDRKKRKKNKNV